MNSRLNINDGETASIIYPPLLPFLACNNNRKNIENQFWVFMKKTEIYERRFILSLFQSVKLTMSERDFFMNEAILRAHKVKKQVKLSIWMEWPGSCPSQSYRPHIKTRSQPDALTNCTTLYHCQYKSSPKRMFLRWNLKIMWARPIDSSIQKYSPIQ